MDSGERGARPEWTNAIGQCLEPVKKQWINVLDIKKGGGAGENRGTTAIITERGYNPPPSGIFTDKGVIFKWRRSSEDRQRGKAEKKMARYWCGNNARRNDEDGTTGVVAGGWFFFVGLVTLLLCLSAKSTRRLRLRGCYTIRETETGWYNVT